MNVEAVDDPQPITFGDEPLDANHLVGGEGGEDVRQT